ncbi:hypothetical protein BEL04_07115 [Mucilaginibacter sp. PPCGB 2223]|uniref:glycosyltransferase family 2 protein n=1 Tax=Mucilaginibacter sp. PPCGB 2223 TaxID=1886027 RepID=UPI0008242A0C|nr:glycosyltransferase family A protein [Mucilaginibacter sp. PPCGB 2223]OCX54037.1 hypothetical protein BEL04_07115 [Mucilaginibacter sp. PPCGB 2223]
MFLSDTSSHPEFSIIVPTYNRAKLIGETIKSLLDQTFKNYEIIVVDDGGTDNTKAIIEDIKDERVAYYWKPNAERGAARNYGASLAKGRYLNFFDSDDIAYSNHLETASRFISENPDVVTFHSGYDWTDVKMKKIRPTVANTGLLNKKIIKHNILSCNNVFIRKVEFDELRFSEDRKLSGTEDWLLWLRIACRYDILGLPTITSAIIEHDLRSMNIATGENTLKRTMAFDENIRLDTCLKQTVYKKAMAEMYYLTALYFSIEGRKRSRAITFAVKAFKLSPVIIGTKRTLAIIKYLLKK